MLTAKQKKSLRAIAQNEKTLVYIGKSGLSDTLFESFEISLLAHNLVKIALQKGAPLSIEEAVYELCDRFSCELVQKIGKTALLYRYHKDGRIKV